MDFKEYSGYIDLLHEELVPALGCTEPISIAYASSVLSKTLGGLPEELTVLCSGGIIKNAQGVTVPNSGGKKGIEVAAVLGALGGNADKKLEVLSSITEEDIQKADKLIGNHYCKIGIIEGDLDFHIIVKGSKKGDEAEVEISGNHTNIVKLEKNGRCLLNGINKSEKHIPKRKTDFITLKGIYNFANTVSVSDISNLLNNQINSNIRISKEGLNGKYGASIGKTLLNRYGDDIIVRAKAMTAAAIDARMSGCELPVVINSGSGNQGIAVSIPVIEYWLELGLEKDKLYRALVISNLVSIYIKSKIGELSAFCGTVSAACGSGAGITFLHGGNYQQIGNTIINILANVSGIICDGAKPSCAAKVASTVDAAILAHTMSMDGKVFGNGEGIVKSDVEETIESIGRLAREGMIETDIEILNIMLDN
ncbi:conserved hypothetical protein [[Clostridium] ultunense Esp]|nr:conserved hypothetical protein [[Clostridium] ultunense Esp]